MKGDDVNFKRKCIEMDDWLLDPLKEGDLKPIARCEITGKPADIYINCANMECNRLFVCSEEGAAKLEGCCSEACMESESRRPYEPENAFRQFRKWYNYFDDYIKDRGL